MAGSMQLLATSNSKNIGALHVVISYRLCVHDKQTAQLATLVRRHTEWEIEGGFLWDNEEPAFGLIRRAFLEAHAQKNKKPPFHQSSDFMKLWKKSTFDPSDEDCPLDIPSSELYPLVAERLCDAGAVRIDQVLNRPCFTFPACNLYAENIDEVLERYEKDLRRDLGIAEKSVEEENQK